MASSPRRITAPELVERHPVVLLDAYGVLVDEGNAISGAREFVDALNRRRHTYYVVTNDASRLPETAAARFARLGLDIPAERIVSSGGLISSAFARHGLSGARCVVLGSPDSRRYVENAGGTVVPAEESFDALVVADDGGYPFLETVNAVLSTLLRQVTAGRTPTLLLPNPDLVYPAGAGRVAVASGGIAALIESVLALRFPGQVGVRFERLGKPGVALFDEACRRAGSRAAVMIGDQLETDIRGAQAAGLASALVGTGVTPLAGLVWDGEVRPTYVMESLAL